MNKDEIKKRLQEIEAEKKQLENTLKTGNDADGDIIWDYLESKYRNQNLHTKISEMDVKCNNFILNIDSFYLKSDEEGKIVVADFIVFIGDYTGTNKFIQRLSDMNFMASDDWLDLIIENKTIQRVMHKPIKVIEDTANKILNDVTEKYPKVDKRAILEIVSEFVS